MTATHALTIDTAGVIQSCAVADVLRERARQDARFGEQNHSLELWLTILTEEIGEFAQEILRQRFGGATRPNPGNLRAELVQATAVALAIIECMDRNPQHYE
jgi:NTP pyrophosphatase (non-canonical NTP hydrolase)